jgi:WD40 repeat protein/tetratricopeptide (TPR) repeat protein
MDLQETLAPEEAASTGGVVTVLVPGYEILGELGRGGMGVVYKARQVGLNRLVALKMILAGGHAGPQERARFRAEAEAVACLQHPNIVQIYEVGEHDGLPFFSLEYVDGGSLAQKLASTPQPPRLAASLLETLARAMHYAHQHNIVHRDLKPVNILLATPARGLAFAPDPARAKAQAGFVPKITDFGLAKQMHSEQGQTRTGAVMGTPSYMAPEQAEGKKDIGPWTDVYALGAIFYEMLTGRPPFNGQTALETVRQVVSTEPVPPTRLQPRVPCDLETICLKCLHKEPKKRYATAEDLADDLRRFLHEEPIRARPTGAVERTIKWAKRRPTLAALVAVSVLALVALFAGGVVHNARLAQAVQRAEDRAEEARQQLVRLHVANGTRCVDEGNCFQAVSSFAEALRLDQGHADRETMHRRRIGAVLRQCPRLAQVWAHQGAVNAVQMGGDGRRVVTASDDHTARIWSTGSSAAAAVLRHDGPVLDVALGGNGRLLATASADGTARLWDARGKPLGTLKHGAAVSGVAFSPDSRELLTVGGATVGVWDVTTGKRLAALKHDAAVRYAAFSQTGRLLVTACDDGAARLWQRAAVPSAGQSTDGTPPLVVRHRGPVVFAAFGNQDRSLVTTSEDRTARVWATATGEPVGPPLGHARAVTRAVFGRDGRRVATAGEDGLVRVWWVATGEMLGALRHGSAVKHVQLSPDGGQVAIASDDNTARVWEAATGEPLTPPLLHNGTVNQLAFSPDGQFLATCSTDHTVRLWNLATRHLLAQAPPWASGTGLPWLPASRHDGAGPLLRQPISSPDGQRVVRRIDDRTVRINDASTGRALTGPLRHAGAVTHAAFSPDSRLLVTASEDQTARVWDVDTGKEVCPALRHASSVKHAAFGPGGQRVVTSGDDNTARVWDVDTGEMLLAPLRHSGTVLHAAFSGDGRLVVTGSEDQTARVWDAATGEVLSPSLKHPGGVVQVAFTVSASGVVTATRDGAVWHWDLPRDDRPQEDITQQAQLLSGSSIDPVRGPMPLDAEQMAAIWAQLHDRYPDEGVSTAEEVAGWHGRAAESAARARQWSAALWHLDRLLPRQDTARLHGERGFALAALGQWEQAAKDYARAARLNPRDTEVGCCHALLCLRMGNQAGYRRACTALLEQQGAKVSAATAALVAWACQLGPDAVPDRTAAVRLAEKALAAEPGNPHLAGVLGGGQYRAGQDERAVEQLNRATALYGRGPAAREWLFLALAEHHRGHTVEARRWLDRATAWLDPKAGAATRQTCDRDALPWVELLELRLLRREAEAVLQGMPPVPPRPGLETPTSRGNVQSRKP